MKKKPAERRKTSWRDIQQGNRRKKTTRTARKRNLSIIFRGLLLVLLLVAIIAGILAIRYFSQQVKPAQPVVTVAPVEIVFKSDGVLGTDWFKTHFKEFLKPDVRRIEVSRLKEQLERHGQIASATVTVSLPSRLTVQLEEREPIMRVRIRDAEGHSRLVLLARDGSLFEGAGYPADTLKLLPGVTGLTVRQRALGFEPVEGIEPVARLLETAKAALPAVYRHWRIVDLSDWDPEVDYRPSLVRIRSLHIEELIFSLDDVEEQIRRLAGILEHAERYQMGQPKYIDLSYGEEAIIRYE